MIRNLLRGELFKNVHLLNAYWGARECAIPFILCVLSFESHESCTADQLNYIFEGVTKASVFFKAPHIIPVCSHGEK